MKYFTHAKARLGGCFFLGAIKINELGNALVFYLPQDGLLLGLFLQFYCNAYRRFLDLPWYNLLLFFFSILAIFCFCAKGSSLAAIVAVFCSVAQLWRAWNGWARIAMPLGIWTMDFTLVWRQKTCGTMVVLGGKKREKYQNDLLQYKNHCTWSRDRECRLWHTFLHIKIHLVVRCFLYARTQQ